MEVQTHSKQAGRILDSFIVKMMNDFHEEARKIMARKNLFWVLSRCIHRSREDEHIQSLHLLREIGEKVTLLRSIAEELKYVKGQVGQRVIFSRLSSFLRSPLLIELGCCSSQFFMDEGAEEIGILIPGLETLKFSISCPICLDGLFRPLALSCGHIFCTSCVFGAVGVSSLEDVPAHSKCPICREELVYLNAYSMTKLNGALKRNFPTHWNEREKQERRLRAIEENKTYIVVP